MFESAWSPSASPSASPTNSPRERSRGEDPETRTLLAHGQEPPSSFFGPCFGPWTIAFCVSMCALGSIVVFLSVSLCAQSVGNFASKGHEVRSSRPRYVDTDEVCSVSRGCSLYWDAEFKVMVVANDDVENQLGYAKAGSAVPESLQGIFWMDQTGASLPIQGDPDYEYNFDPTAEVLMTFNDNAIWQADTRCVTPTYLFGGVKGHWTHYNTEQGLLMSEKFQEHATTMHFCFIEDSEDEIDIWVQAKYNAVAYTILKGLGYEEAWNGTLFQPGWVMELKMVKTSWGWDRVSNIGSNRLRRENVPDSEKTFLDQFIPEWLKDQITTTYRYPVYQIVDGNGDRTEHYETYLKFMQNPEAIATSGEAIEKSPTGGQLYRVLQGGEEPQISFDASASSTSGVIPDLPQTTGVIADLPQTTVITQVTQEPSATTAGNGANAEPVISLDPSKWNR